MFDIKAIRDNPDWFDAGLKKRGLEPQAAGILELDERLRKVIADTQEAQTARNEASKEIGRAKAGGDEAAAQAVIEKVSRLKAQIQEGEELERKLSDDMTALLSGIPNIPADDVPLGEDESQNVERHTHGTKRDYNFPPKEHWDIGEPTGLMDFELAAKLSGSRFVVLKSAYARFERAIANFMIDLHTEEFGYTEVAAPFLVRDHVMYGTAQLPKFEEDQFKTTDGFWLVPTAEVSLTNLVRESILAEDELPLRFTAFTQCFRKEAGSAGRDTRGMIRMHQFPKVELVSITAPEKSGEEHERMLSCAEEVLKRLELPYRVVTLCTGDMGFSARKTYDIEVWLPGQDSYREISSCSVCGDFQARRMNARFRPSEGKGTRFVHTLNGSGLAVGRTMVAILETYQQVDGSVTVPDVLKPYMKGMDALPAPDA